MKSDEHMIEGFVNSEVNAVFRYDGRRVYVGLTLVHRDRYLSVEAYRGMLKAMLRLDDRIGVISDGQ